MSKIIITEEQFYKVLSKWFNTMYKKVRYKYNKDKTRLSVYYGDKLLRPVNPFISPTYILEYYPKDGSLWISNYVYTKFKKMFPFLETHNMLFYDFFKKMFSDKFGITPKKVYITNERSLNDRYHNQ
jgi:hypothetical protein